MTNATVLVGWRRRWNLGLLQFLDGRAHKEIEVEDLAHVMYPRPLRAHSPQAYPLRAAGHAR